MVETVIGPNGTEVDQTRVLCQECSEGMVCDQPGMNWTQIFPEKGYFPMLNTDPETLQMIECISPGLYYQVQSVHLETLDNS